MSGRVSFGNKSLLMSSTPSHHDVRLIFNEIDNFHEYNEPNSVSILTF